MPESITTAHPGCFSSHTGTTSSSWVVMLVAAALSACSSTHSDHKRSGSTSEPNLVSSRSNPPEQIQFANQLIRYLPESNQREEAFSKSELGVRLRRMTGRELTPHDVQTLVALRALLVAQREIREGRPTQARELAKFVMSTEHLGTNLYALALRYLAVSDVLTLSAEPEKPVTDGFLARHPKTEFNALQSLQCAAVCQTHGWQILSREDPGLLSAAGYRTRVLSENVFKSKNLVHPDWLKKLFLNTIATSKKEMTAEIQPTQKDARLHRVLRLKVLVESRQWTQAASLAKKILAEKHSDSSSSQKTKLCPADTLFAQYTLAQANRIAQDRRAFARLQDEFVADLERSQCSPEAFAFDKEQFDSFKLDARLWLARLQWEQQQNPEAFHSARKVITDATNLQSWEHFFDAAKVLIGRIGFEMLQPTENLSFLSALERTSTTPESEEFYVWIHSRKGFFHFLDGDFNNARQSFERIIELTSDTSTRAMAFYWIGRSYQASDKRNEAENAFLSSGMNDPLSIYDIFSGQLLARESGRASTQSKRAFDADWRAEMNTWLHLHSEKPLRIISSVPPRASLVLQREAPGLVTFNSQKQFDLSLETAMLFVALTKAVAVDLSADELGRYLKENSELLPAYLRSEAQHLRQSFQRLNTLHSEVLPRAHQVAWLTHVLGDYANAILFVGRLRETIGWDTDYLPFLYFIFYPRPFHQAFQTAAQRCDVDVDLLYAISRQESLFQAGAKSPVGAIGLMQLLPSTAANTLKNIPEFKSRDNYDLTAPEVNTLAGACYLKQLLQRYNNNLTYAIAAYNAGEAAVDNWVNKRQKLADMPFFIEFIPYAETKTYVQRVLRNYYNIKWIYRSPTEQ